MRALRTLWLLFRVNFCVSAFTFGGGYVVIPMMRKHFVQNRALLAEEDLMDIAAIAQSSPGAIAVNTSSLVGYRLAGLPGAAVSCLGAVLPPLLILAVVSHYYQAFRESVYVAAALRGMQAGVAAIVLELVAGMAAAIFRRKNPLHSALMPLAFAASFFFGVNVLWILLGSVALCLLPLPRRAERRTP